MSKRVYSSEEITEILRNWGGGDQAALDMLLPLVYTELRRQAHRYMNRENQGHTMQTTDLIHEAYIKLVEQKNIDWQSRTHFFAIAANQMRHVLVDYARARNRLKRGGKGRDLPLDEAMLIAAGEDVNVNLLELDEALNRLAEFDAQQARIVELRYFSGLSLEETAEALNISVATVKRDWNMAKAWLRKELSN